MKVCSRSGRVGNCWSIWGLKVFTIQSMVTLPSPLIRPNSGSLQAKGEYSLSRPLLGSWLHSTAAIISGVWVDSMYSSIPQLLP